MVESVVQSLPIHVMTCFRLPSDICKKLSYAIATFFWSGYYSNHHKIHWVSWTNLCEHEAKGGLGFRDLILFN